MTAVRYRLLLIDAGGEATTSLLGIRTLREFPGPAGLSVHFRPVRSDLLFESARVGGELAYRILSGEGIVRSQLSVEYEVLGEHLNVVGRSSDLLFALALLTSAWTQRPAAYECLAATGVLDGEGAVHSVERVREKIVAAVRDLGSETKAVIFYPAADFAAVEQLRGELRIFAHVLLQPVAHLEEALAFLGYRLEKVYLRNPFRGLEPFEYEHHAIFFGRDREVREVVTQLLRRDTAGTPGLLVEGASGSGKSSFLRAGVLPALVEVQLQSESVRDGIGQRPISPHASRAIWRPGLTPSGVDERKIVLSIIDCWAVLPDLQDGWSDGPIETLAELAQRRREHWPGTLRFVWLIDQFEELFTLGLEDSLIDTFGRFLCQLQADTVWTLASMRADAIPELKRHQALRQVFGANEGQYYLAALSRSALDDVILRPAQAAALTFGLGPGGEPLDRLLREEASLENDSLPLLEFTLHELYLRRSGQELTYVSYQQLGGLSGSIATTAEAVLKIATVESPRSVARLFRNLVSVDDSGRATRSYAPLAEIAADPAQKQLLSDSSRRDCAPQINATAKRRWRSHTTRCYSPCLRSSIG